VLHRKSSRDKHGRIRGTTLRRPRDSSLARYIKSTLRETYLPHFTFALVVSWLSFATALYFAEQAADEPVISSYGEALYWGVAAFSTAGIADTPASPLSQLIGGVWIVVGSVIFFGIIVASVTGYFMHTAQHPFRRLINLIEYNLEHIQDQTLEELDLLKETTSALILHVENTKEEHGRRTD
jgi:voltage-gated potassium channel